MRDFRAVVLDQCLQPWVALSVVHIAQVTRVLMSALQGIIPCMWCKGALVYLVTHTNMARRSELR